LSVSIKAAIREADLPARYGGDEFVVLLHGCPYAEAVEAAKRIRVNVEALAASHVGSPPGIVTLRIGLAHTSERETDDADKSPEAADSALYEAKRRGKNQVYHRQTAEVT